MRRHSQRRPRARVAAPALVLAALLATAGCADDGGATEEIELDASPSAAAPDDPDASAGADAGATDGSKDGADRTVPRDPRDGELIAGREPRRLDAEQRAVLDVHLAYWDERLRSFRTQRVDQGRVHELATGAAAAFVVSYSRELARQGHDQMGGAILGVRRVSVTGDRARVLTCFRNSAVDVDARTRKPVEPAVAFAQTTDLLVREGPDWRVTSTTLTSNDPCEYR
ncbi:hypothetical protein [Nocardioides bruguierae]|uniref:hypothetical protein n=1 Tax=Nocardioides bruguierae TaxID=2945102 RepID=UPI0020219A6B|nr:hypothetical protein [Nocardioides bruguierae]MCL8025208.1 hypothetical protein [Nocardioides bruguierae]